MMDTAPDLSTNMDDTFWLIFEQAGVGMALISPEGYYLRANPEFCNMLGYTEDQLRSLTSNDITHPDDAAAENELSSKLLTDMSETGASTYRAEKRYRRRDGRFVWGSVSVSLVRHAGLPVHFIAVIQDITERKQAREELEQARNRYQAIYDDIDDFISINDLRGDFTFASASSVNVLGYAPTELVGTNVFRYVHPDDYDVLYEAYRKFNEGSNEHLRVRYRAFRKDGLYVWVETYARAFDGVAGTEREIVCISRGVPDRQLTQETLTLELDKQVDNEKTGELAHEEEVSGLLNRKEIDELLGSKLVSPRSANFPFGVLLVDVDNFKSFNGTYGRMIGDEIVRRVSVALQEMCRPDDVIGRYGDDEFLVVLPNTNPSGTIVVGEKLIRAVREIDWSDRALQDEVTVSIGATCVTYGAERTLPELMGILEQQLYQAKDAGRDRLVMNTRQTSQKLGRS